MTSTLVDAHLRAAMSVPGVEMRMAVIVVVHPDRDPEEAADRRHDHNVAAHPDRTAPSRSRAPLPRLTRLPPVRLLRAAFAHPFERQCSVLPPDPLDPQKAQSFRAERL